MVTNDGNAILRELDLAHPAAKVQHILLALFHCASYCFAYFHPFVFNFIKIFKLMDFLSILKCILFLILFIMMKFSPAFVAGSQWLN